MTTLFTVLLVFVFVSAFLISFFFHQKKEKRKMAEQVTLEAAASKEAEEDVALRNEFGKLRNKYAQFKEFVEDKWWRDVLVPSPYLSLTLLEEFKSHPATAWCEEQLEAFSGPRMKELGREIAHYQFKHIAPPQYSRVKGGPGSASKRTSFNFKTLSIRHVEWRSESQVGPSSGVSFTVDGVPALGTPLYGAYTLELAALKIAADKKAEGKRVIEEEVKTQRMAFKVAADKKAVTDKALAVSTRVANGL